LKATTITVSRSSHISLLHFVMVLLKVWLSHCVLGLNQWSAVISGGIVHQPSLRPECAFCHGILSAKFFVAGANVAFHSSHLTKCLTEVDLTKCGSCGSKQAPSFQCDEG
jgi:hypothetical protein